MLIRKDFVGKDFELPPGGLLPLAEPYKFGEDELTVEAVLSSAQKDNYDTRTGYFCQPFTGDPSHPNPADDWYINYLRLNQEIVLDTNFRNAADFVHNPAYNLLGMGYLPLSFAPSFCSGMTPFVVSILESVSVPYITHYPCSFVYQKYRNNFQDVWVSRMSLYERMGVAPENITIDNVLRWIVREWQSNQH